MKTILVILFCITSSKCGVLRDDMKNSNVAPITRFETQLIIVIDSFDVGNITLLTEILVDITKDQEGRPKNIESVTKNYHLQPGMHKWEIKFHSSEQSVDEINRVMGIVENTARKTGQLVGKNCITGENTVTCQLTINVAVTSQTSSKIHKRDVQFQNNSQPTDIDEINRLLSLAEAAENKNGETDGKKCTTTDGVVICNVYIPKDPSNIHKRDTEFQNNSPPTDEDVIKEKLDIVDENGNTCTATATTIVDNKVYCLFSTSDALFGGCPPGTDRADDNTCVPIID